MLHRHTKTLLLYITLVSLLSSTFIFLNIKNEIKSNHASSQCSPSLLVDCSGTLSLSDSYYKIAKNSFRRTTVRTISTQFTSDFNSSQTTNITTNTSNNQIPHVSSARISEKLRRNEAIKISMINRPDWLKDLLPTSFPCLRHKCVFDTGSIDNETDVVFVYGVLLEEKEMPSKRWDGQLYVFGAMESPFHLRSRVTTAKSVWRYAFNLTATYKRDADIFWPYGTLRYEPSPISERPNYRVIAESKRKTAVALVSNCKTQSKREQYIKEMKKYVDIDIYGRCGQPTNCSRAEYGPCMVQLLRQYKFYIAFENSICDDYISEKLFKIYVPNNHIIPVVRGGADFDTLLPNNTFVNADWFKTAKDLALFLTSLSEDVDAYSRHLQAKDVYKSETREKILCTLCETLTSSGLRPRVYDIKTWLNGQCRAPRSFK